MRRQQRADAARRLAVAAAVLALALAALGGTGIGASDDSHTIDTFVDPTMSITEPTALETSPAPLNGASWTVGSPSALDLGDLAGSETAAASLTWEFTTNNPAGYQVQLSNTRPAGTVMESASSDVYADMPTTPGPLDTSTTAFGVAVGDAVGHAQASVDYPGNPWGTTGASGTQGTLYSGVPSAGMVIASRSTPQTDDPVTVNFAANISSSDLPAAAAYTGTVRITATTL